MKRKIMPKIMVIAALFLLCLGMTGCDRTAPEVSGVGETIEMDCGTKLNLEDYLNENLSISDETDDGKVDYKLSELEHTITNDDSIYNAETGDVDTDKPGEYNFTLTVQDEKKNKAETSFTLVLKALKMESTVEDLIEMDCGTPFNVKDYLKEHVSLSNQAGDVKYQLDDFDYTIDCDESVYNANTGTFDTTKFGEFTIKFTIESESFDNNSVSFKVKLNPLVIEKDAYVYENEFSSTGFEYMGFCEYKNTSSEDLKVKSIEFKYFDKDDIMIASNDYPDYSLEYVKSGASGYALDSYSYINSAISSPDEIARVEVIIDFGKPAGNDTTSLEVGDVEITKNYDYNVSGFAGTAIVTNPYDKDVEYYTFLAGMYDADGKLIGVMDAMNTEGIGAGGKARCTAAWLPDSKEIPDQVDSVKASAKVESFVGE